MPDLDKVIKGMTLCIKYDRDCTQCPYDQSGCVLDLKADALALLKEQEPVAPKRIDGKKNHFIKCGNCNDDLMTGMNFCPKCGKAVKWDA